MPDQHLFVATPCYGGQVTLHYTNSLMHLYAACLAKRIKLTWHLIGGDALITRARAELVSSFLNTDGTHLIFIDADIGFAPDQVFRLMEFRADICAAAYPLKEVDWSKIGRAVAAGKTEHLSASTLNYVVAWDQEMRAKDGFVRVRYAGNGFLLIRRQAIEQLCAAYRELSYRQIHAVNEGAMAPPHEGFALFDTMIDRATGEYLSEDYAFCRRWTDIGGEIWIDTQSKLTHTGPVTFGGDLSSQFK
jgi:hypothetical protein